MLTVQYPEDQVRTLNDLKQIPIRATKGQRTTQLDSVADMKSNQNPPPRSITTSFAVWSMCMSLRHMKILAI